MIPNDCPTATGSSPSSHVTDVVFSISSSASQPSSVTANVCVRKTSAGPSAGERSTQSSVAVCGGAGIAGGGSPDDELQPETSSPAASASPRTARGRRTPSSSHRPCRPPRPLSASLPPGVDLYEYQGKELFRRVGIPVSEGRLATTPEEARTAAEELGGPVVVKAQVLTGGRGKAGGIKLAADPDEAEERAREILGLDIRGHVVRRLWIEQASDIAKEYYLSLTFDRGAKKALYMFTTRGRRRHRAGRRGEPRGARPAARRPARGLPSVAGAAARLRRRRHRSVRAEADRRDRREAARRVRALRRDALRDQPADRDARRRGEGARLEVHGRRQRALPPSRHRRDARPRRRRPARGARPREARHVRQARRRGRACSATAPGSRCRRSTSSRSRAAGRRTSATSAAAATRRASSTRSR